MLVSEIDYTIYIGQDYSKCSKILNTFLFLLSNKMDLNPRKLVFGGFANTKGADQPAHPRSLISTFVIC